jgi:cell division protein FtsQ
MSNTGRQTIQRRSDQVRQRRQQTSQRRINQAAERSTRPMAVPPVISRGGMASVPLRQRVQTHPRRQYYYSLNTTGAEVRLPALPAIHPGWRLLSGALVLGLAAALFLLWNFPLFQLSAARVVGAKRLSAHDINAVLDVAGLPAVEASPREMEDELLTAFPDLEAVDVRVGFPASLLVSVKERVPLIAWEQNGQTLWIDEQGVAFPPRGEPPENLLLVQAQADPVTLEPKADAAANGVSLPSITAAHSTLPGGTAVAKPFLPPELIPGILAMKAEAPSGTALAYDPRYGLGWNDPKGWRVYFGFDKTDMGSKLIEYQAIVAKLEKDGIKPALISVQFIHAPFYRLEP